MGMTITEKILAAHAGKDEVRAGELISIPVDMILGNDVTAPLAIQEFERIGVKTVFDPDKIALVPDHFTPNKDIKSAEQVKIMRNLPNATVSPTTLRLGEWVLSIAFSLNWV